MIVGGFQKFSLIDYPGKICAVIYTRGCNFRCPYCHNPELVYPEQYAPVIPMEEVMEFLQGRQGLLEAVTITGGEPTLHLDLPDVIRQIKEMGFLLKLDTNGCHPGILKNLVVDKLLDYVAMDIKAPLEKYSVLSGVAVNIAGIKESIKYLLRGEVDYEFRTTVDRSLLDKEDLLKIGDLIHGAEKYYLQKLNCHTSKSDISGKNVSSDEVWMRRIADRLGEDVDYCGVR